MQKPRCSSWLNTGDGWLGHKGSGTHQTFRCGLPILFSSYFTRCPLVSIQKTMEHHHAINGKLFLWPCSIAMFVYQRVIPHIILLFTIVNHRKSRFILVKSPFSRDTPQVFRKIKTRIRRHQSRSGCSDSTTWEQRLVGKNWEMDGKGSNIWCYQGFRNLPMVELTRDLWCY